MDPRFKLRKRISGPLWWTNAKGKNKFLATLLVTLTSPFRLKNAEARAKFRDPFGERLEDLISLWGLTDIKPKNGKFTWSNKRAGPGHIATRLDQFLVSTTFLQKDLLLSSHIISSATSDHKPILLSFSLPTNLGPIPFRFNHLWLNNAKTLDIIHTAWNFTLSGSPSYIWESKIRVVRSSLKNWAATSYS